MKKVITYGTYDVLHYGHIRLLQRAKALGDYLIVGVTSDLYDKQRGKFNVQDDVIKRIENIKNTGLADKIILEEYDGQKIDDIKKYNIDIFAIGSDWNGKFDYLEQYCEVVYLDRTMGISSTMLRSGENIVKLGIIGDSTLSYKVLNEANYVNGLEISGIFSNYGYSKETKYKKYTCIEGLIENSDALYIVSPPSDHYNDIKKCLMAGKNVICESPIVYSVSQLRELMDIAKEKNLILFDSLKTAFSMAYQRLILNIKSGVIGDIISIDATCTSLEKKNELNVNSWNSFFSWGPTALLPILQILGISYENIEVFSKFDNKNNKFDLFSFLFLRYKNAIATIRVGKGVKSEGSLIISGTKGYAYVPAPWWKNDYFEIRFENQNENKKFYYQIDGEGIRQELIEFKNAINGASNYICIQREITKEIVKISERFIENDKNYIE